MDKKKIISSLTLAGMLATSVAGSGVFAAETSDPATKALGEYSKLITGKVAVPFILQSEADRVTGKDVKVAFPGKTVTIADDAVLKTGDVVNVNGEPRTIVIYGDTNCDGKINIMDAVTTLNHVKGKATLTGAAFAAADLNNNGDINILEAVGALNVVKGKAEYGNIATAPKAEEVVVKVTNREIIDANTIKLKFDADASKYTYELQNDQAETDVNKKVAINHVTYDSNKKIATLNVATLNAYTDANKQTYTLTVKDTNGNVVSKDTFKYIPLKEIGEAKVEGKFNAINVDNQNSLSYKVSIDDSNNEPTTVVVTLKDSALKEVTGTATLPANANAVSVNNFVGVANLKDGTIDVNIKITDENGNVVEEDSTTTVALKIKKDTEALVIANIETERNDKTVNATVTMKNGASTNKQYFIVKKASESAPTASEVVAGEKTIPTDLSKVKLDDGVAYTIYVVAENANGVRSEMVSANIAKANAVQLKTVGNPEVNPNVAGEFTWTDDNNDAKGYKAILYAVTSDPVPTYKAIAVKETSEKKVNFLKEIKEYAQENKTVVNYKVAVIAVGDFNEFANSLESPKSTSSYRIESITNPTNVQLTFDTDNTNHQILTWSLVQEAAFYNVNIYKYYEDGIKIAEDPIKTIAVSKENAKCDLTDAMKALEEGKYAVKVAALAPTDSLKIDSIEVPVNDNKAMYNVKAPTDLTLSLKNSRTVTASLTAISSILTSDVGNIEYELHYGFKLDNGKVMYDKDSNGGTSGSDKCEPVELNKEGSLFNADINVTPEKTYGMYVSVLFNGIEIARTDAKEITIAKAPIAVSGLTVAEWNGVATIGEHKIAYSGDKLNIEGHVYTSNDVASNYSEILKVVKVLSAGDTITQNNTTGQISVTKVSTVKANYGDALKDVDLIVGSNGAKISGTVKSVTLPSGITTADLQGAKVTEKVVVKADDTVDVKAGTKVVAPTGTVTINGIAVNTAAETEIKVTETGLSIPGSNNPVEITADDDATIEFTSKDDNTYQSGDVTLTEDNADKTLSVSGKLAGVTIAKGNVNISGVTEYSQIHVENGTNVILSGNSKKVNFNGMTKPLTITPKAGDVKVKYADGAINVEGRASVEFTTIETEDRNASIGLNNKAEFTLLKDENNLIHKAILINNQGDVSYTVKEQNAKVDIAGTITLGEYMTVTSGETIIASNSTTILVPAGTAIINGATIETATATDITTTADGFSIPASATVTVNGNKVVAGADAVVVKATDAGLEVTGIPASVKAAANKTVKVKFVTTESTTSGTQPISGSQVLNISATDNVTVTTSSANVTYVVEQVNTEKVATIAGDVFSLVKSQI